MKRIFWDYKRSFLGISLISPMMQKVVIAPAIILTTLGTLQYGITSNVYYDQYDGEVRQFNGKK